MPLRNEPKSLKEASMVSIARNFDYLCYNCRTPTEMRALMENDAYLNIEGPFKSLPSSLLTDLMSVIEGGDTNFYLQKKHLNVLLQPQLEILKLPPTSGANYFGFELIQKRCKKLRHLDLSYLCHISPLVLIQLVPRLEHLVVFNLKMTEITDQVLGLIGKHCSNIRELDISFCPITNQGIYSLCYNDEEMKIQCTKLVRFSFMGCMVQPAAVSFLIQCVPTIRDLEFENIFQVFNVMNHKYIRAAPKDSSPQSYYLNSLTASDDNVTVANAEIAVNLCPLASSVTISNCIIQNEVLYKLMLLQNLTHLRLTNSDSLSLDFFEGVLPLLTLCGARLLSLLLAKFTALDVNAIGECCPMLRNLAVSNIAMYEGVMFPRDNLFTELTALEIWTDIFDETMDTAMLKQLLAFCPRIHNILVSGSKYLSDDLLEEIWKINKMRELSRLTIENCPNISKLSLENLLESQNDIVLIRIWSCLLISKADNDYLQKKIKNENCDLYLEWYAWMG